VRLTGESFFESQRELAHPFLLDLCTRDTGLEALFGYGSLDILEPDELAGLGQHLFSRTDRESEQIAAALAHNPASVNYLLAIALSPEWRPTIEATFAFSSPREAGLLGSSVIAISRHPKLIDYTVFAARTPGAATMFEILDSGSAFSAAKTLSETGQAVDLAIESYESGRMLELLDGLVQSQGSMASLISAIATWGAGTVGNVLDLSGRCDEMITALAQSCAYAAIITSGGPIHASHSGPNYGWFDRFVEKAPSQLAGALTLIPIFAGCHLARILAAVAVREVLADKMGLMALLRTQFEQTGTWHLPTDSNQTSTGKQPTHAMSMAMSHVFISYSRCDQEVVDRIAKRLRAQGLTVWVDRDDIQPGQRWKPAIKEAIRNGAAFLACFSQESLSLQRSYMNEELVQAIEEIRIRSRDQKWFFPLRIDECQIPDLAIGGGESLSDLHHLDLFPNEEHSFQKLVESILPNVHIHKSSSPETSVGFF
jgi:TIR domain